MSQYDGGQRSLPAAGNGSSSRAARYFNKLTRGLTWIRIGSRFRSAPAASASAGSAAHWPGRPIRRADESPGLPDWTEVGGTEWRLFIQQVLTPIIRDKRVLVLGTGSEPGPHVLMRAGAREVVVFEFSGAVADVNRLRTRILSQHTTSTSDNSMPCDLRLFIANGLGRFEVVTAFCSLYDLPGDEMARIVRKAALMNAALVVQANENVDHLPARTLDLHRLMSENGYTQITVHTPAGLERPVLIGYSQLAAMRLTYDAATPLINDAHCHGPRTIRSTHSA